MTPAANSRPAPPSTKTPPDPSPASISPPQARAQLKCGWERFTLVAREVWALAQRNAIESGWTRPVNPNWDALFAMDRAGYLGLWTARHEGVMVGYALCDISPALFFSDRFSCTIKVIWLAPEWRDGLRGLRFLRGLLAAAREVGVSLVWLEVNDLFRPDPAGRSRVAMLLEREGFRPTGVMMELDYG